MISYSGPNVPQVTTLVYFGGRYQLGMKVVVEVSDDFSAITKVKGEPKFYFFELSRVPRPPNSLGSYDGSSERSFGRDEWQKIVAAKGDFSVIGIKLKRGPPIPGFDEYVRSIRSEFVRVSPYDPDKNSGGGNGSGVAPRRGG